jgi:hypothetical protein
MTPSSSEEKALELIESNKARGSRPFKTRNKVGERPIGLRQQRKAKRDSE